MSGVSDNKAVGWKDMPGQPRNCSRCGEAVTLARGGWFDTMRRLTWHHGCHPRRSEGRS